MLLPAYNDIPIGQGLEELAKIVGEVKQNGAVPRVSSFRLLCV
ncbi:unnamed protein product [marine sediment metagenome]|uniref:Uncharacterized protein n=1 Tax=marine sediment metagenome TaxID=412755 RepID=X1KKA1_9ZZZZ